MLNAKPLITHESRATDEFYRHWPQTGPILEGMSTKKVKRTKLGWREGSVRQRGGKFQVRWREAGERLRLSGFGSRAGAVEELEKIQARLSLGQPSVAPKVVPKPRGRRFSDLLEDWIEHRRAHKVRSASEDRARWQRHLAP